MLSDQKIAIILTQLKKTVSVAESCTGGLLGHRMTNIAGSSNYFHGGIIAYSNSIKTQYLNVSSALIKKNGAVSAPVAIKMASAIRKLFKSDFGISVTGIAGPTKVNNNTTIKPVGLVFIAVADAQRVICEEFHFQGSRTKIKSAAVDSALKLLLKIIQHP